MKSSGLKIILISLVLTSTVLWLRKYENTSLQEMIDSRNLQTITPEYYANICVKDNNITLGYAEDFVGLADTVEGYIQQISFYKPENKDKIEAIVINDDTGEVASLVISIFGGFIVVAVFGILSLFAWLVYCICCCKQCFCCKSTTKDEKWCSLKGISCIIMLVSLGGIVIICIIGWIFASKFPDKVDDLECSLLRFYKDTKYGEDKITTPKWIGFSGIYSKINNIHDALTQVYQNSNNAFSDTSSSTQTQNSYYQLLDTKYNENSGVTVENPNPESSTGTVTPAFIQTWGPKSKDQTTLFFLQQEYDYTITGAASLLNDLESATNSLNSNIAEGRATFSSAAELIDPINDQIDVFETDYIIKFVDNVSNF